MRLVRQVIQCCDNKLRHLKAGKIKSVSQTKINKAKLCIRRAFFEATGRYTMISYFVNDAVASFWRQRDARKMLSSGILTPDELVYANGPAMWVGKCEPQKTCPEQSRRIASRLTKQINKGQKHSVAFLIKDVGLFVAGKKKIDDDVLEELEELLITSDIGVLTTMELIERLSKAKVADASEIKQILKDVDDVIKTIK